MTREINLLDWLPPYLQEYREIKEIMTVENPEIKTLYEDISTSFNNQFVLHCNETGIERFEKLLKIVPNSDDNLAGRISRVLARFNDSIPYTYRGLIQKLNVMCGEGNYTVDLNHNEYTLEITVSLVNGGQIEELDYMLSYMIPANLIVKSSNTIKNEPAEDIFLGGVVTTHKEVEILSTLSKERVLKGEVNNLQAFDILHEVCINTTLDKAHTIEGEVNNLQILDVYKEDVINSNLTEHRTISAKQQHVNVIDIYRER